GGSGAAVGIQGAGTAAAARRSVGRVRVRANAGGRIAYARHVARIGRSADDGAPADAAPRLAGVPHRAAVPVGAGRAVGGSRIRADARGGVARARDVALIQGFADDGGGARAGPRL